MKCLPSVLLYSLINQSILAFLVISFTPASFSLRVSCALSAGQSSCWWFEISGCRTGHIAFPGFESAEWLNLLGLLLMPHFYSYILWWAVGLKSSWRVLLPLCAGSRLEPPRPSSWRRTPINSSAISSDVLRGSKPCSSPLQGCRICSPVVLRSF